MSSAPPLPTLKIGPSPSHEETRPMTWILEEPIYIIILGIILLLFLGFALTQTGYRSILHAMLGVVALTIGLLILENAVVTDKELVESALERIADDVRNNDHDAVYQHVYSGAPEILARAKSEFPMYVFEDVDIKDNVEVEFTEGEPREARVTFNVVVNVHRGPVHFRRVPRFVEATLVWEDEQWKVADYRHSERGVFGGRGAR
jgi:hypothetical protein